METQEQALISFRAEVREWMGSAIPPSWKEIRVYEEDEILDIRRSWDKLMYGAGFAGLLWPKEYGGRDMPTMAQVIFYEEAGRAHAPEELDIVGKYLAAPALMEYGSQEQLDHYLEPILKCQEIWCEGFSEPNAGSDLANVETRAVRRGDQYHVYGQKIWTTHARYADRMYLLCRTAPDLPRHQSLSVLLLDMHQPGVRVVPIRQITGDRHFGQVFFDDATVPAADMLGEENTAWSLVTLLGHRRRDNFVEALRRYAQMVTMLDNLEICSREAGRSDTWHTFRQQLELLHRHIVRAVQLRDANLDWYPAASFLKINWSELMKSIATAGIELPCARHREYWWRVFFETRATSIYGGSTEIQRNVVSKAVLNLRQPARGGNA